MLNEELVKEYISKNVLPQADKSNENILRKIIFECADIDWNKLLEVINKEHPENKLWGSEFNGYRLDKKLLKRLQKEYPDITEYDWLYEYYMLYESVRNKIEEVAKNNNNIVPKFILNDYGITARHIQITFNDKYSVEGF